MRLSKTEISFVVEDTEYKFNVYHNLPKQFGLSIECAVENWAARTKSYKAASLCKYIMSKQPERVCMTESQFQII